MKQYDLVIVGAGLFGAVMAFLAKQNGKRCLVIDKREHVGGNVYTENIANIEVHKYGAHIFHTNNKGVWDFVNKFGEFNNFINSPVANYKGKLYSLPFNMNTFYQIWGAVTPEQAADIINRQRSESGIMVPKNLEEQAVSLVGKDIYELLIKGYTEKQWGRPCTELPPSIIKRLPVRFKFDNNYFNAKYQGIPLNGYTTLIKNMLSGVEVQLNIDYFSDRNYFDVIARHIVFTGAIDRYFDYCYGPLSYRKVRFETEILNKRNFQGVAVMNFTDKDVPYTRIIEHKHFGMEESDMTVVSWEYSDEWKIGDEPYYPIGDDENNNLYLKYKAMSGENNHVSFGGRLGSYKYFDMDQTIEEAICLAHKILK